MSDDQLTQEELGQLFGSTWLKEGVFKGTTIPNQGLRELLAELKLNKDWRQSNLEAALFNEAHDKATKKIEIYEETLKLIKDKHLSCDCMDAPGLAASALKQGEEFK
jgi:hypothetical protein